jgi:hypothetical protein
MLRKDLKWLGGGFVAVLGAGLVGSSLAGIAHHAAPSSGQAEARPTVTVTASPSRSAAPAAAPSPTPTPQASATGPPGFRAQPIAVRTSAPSGPAASRPVTPRPTSSAKPPPKPTPSPTATTRCASGAVLAVQLPLTVLPHCAITLGGS